MLALEIASKLELEPKKYYILKPRNIRKRDIKNNGKYIVINVIYDNCPYVICLLYVYKKKY